MRFFQVAGVGEWCWLTVLFFPKGPLFGPVRRLLSWCLHVWAVLQTGPAVWLWAAQRALLLVPVLLSSVCEYLQHPPSEMCTVDWSLQQMFVLYSFVFWRDLSLDCNIDHCLKLSNIFAFEMSNQSFVNTHWQVGDFTLWQVYCWAQTDSICLSVCLSVCDSIM